MQPTYNVWVQLEITVPEYLKAKVDALKHLRDKFQREGRIEAKEKAEQLLDGLRKEVDNYGA